MEGSVVTLKGQVVIPQPIRKALGLKPGDRLDVESIEGSIVLRPRRNLLELAGAFDQVLSDGMRKLMGDDKRQLALPTSSRSQVVQHPL